MLRISQTASNGSHVTLKLEGRIADQWAALLEGECRALLRHDKHVQLDFSDVDFIDESGIEVVRNFLHNHVAIINAPGFIEELLQIGGRS